MTAPTRRPPVRSSAGSRRLDDLRAAGRRCGRRRALRRLSWAALLVLPLLGLAWLLLASPLLGVSHVRVSGAASVPAEEVVRAAAVPDGTPLARVDAAGVRARVGALAPVARARVVREWPRTLRVVVIERVPVAVTRDPSGGDGAGWLRVDPTGARFAGATERPAGLPEVDGGGAPADLAVLQTLGQLPPALLGQVQRATAATPASVHLELRGGRTVVWGEPGDPGETARKAAVVSALLGRPGDTIDVAAPGIAVVR